MNVNYDLKIENEQKIINCQNLNEKNLQINNELKVKLEAVTERLD